MEKYKTYVLYDDMYLGPGFFIITELDNEIVKFIKLSICSQDGFPNFFIRAYEKDSYDKSEEKFRKITFNIDKEESLYYILSEFSKELNNRKINSIDISNYGRNYFETRCKQDSVSIIFNKDVYGVKEPTDFIDIMIGDNYSCNEYIEILKLYRDLSVITKDKTTTDDIKRILRR